MRTVLSIALVLTACSIFSSCVTGQDAAITTRSYAGEQSPWDQDNRSSSGGFLSWEEIKGFGREVGKTAEKGWNWTEDKAAPWTKNAAEDAFDWSKGAVNTIGGIFKKKKKRTTRLYSAGSGTVVRDQRTAGINNSRRQRTPPNNSTAAKPGIQPPVRVSQKTAPSSNGSGTTIEGVKISIDANSDVIVVKRLASQILKQLGHQLERTENQIELISKIGTSCKHGPEGGADPYSELNIREQWTKRVLSLIHI